MFTFGRQHEKECAVRYLKDPQQTQLIEEVVDAIHDVLESRSTVDAVRPILSRGFMDGGSGVWEQTGSWIRKLAVEYPSLDAIWREFAENREPRVRFRAACFIDEMPLPLAVEIGALFLEDRSKKVREMAQAKLPEGGN